MRDKIEAVHRLMDGLCIVKKKFQLRKFDGSII